MIEQFPILFTEVVAVVIGVVALCTGCLHDQYCDSSVLGGLIVITLLMKSGSVRPHPSVGGEVAQVSSTETSQQSTFKVFSMI